MKTIKVMETIVDIMSMYKGAKTPSQRALVGFIVKSGSTLDPVFGGAFSFLCKVERCMSTNEIYNIMPFTEPKYVNKILYIAQLAIDGKFNQFAMSEKEIASIIKILQEIPV